MILNWTDPEKQMLDEIADPAMGEKDIIINYGALIILTGYGEPDSRINFAKINDAIVNRWSKTARDRIKRAAWKEAEAAWNEAKAIKESEAGNATHPLA